MLPRPRAIPAARRRHHAACAHRDAHLVKYTLACLDAAAADPDAARLFHAGAASLLAFWEAPTPTA